jgi:hypothetical protein
VTKTVSSAETGTGVAGFKKKPKGVTPPSNPGRQRVFLTDVIVELGFADQDKVDSVVAAARNTSKTLEDLLLEHYVVDEDQLSRAIAERNGLDHVNLDEFDIDLGAAAKITASMARRHRAVPISFANDEALIVAVADPFDSMAISDIEEMAKCEVRLAIATPAAIDRLIERPSDGPKLEVINTEAPDEGEPATEEEAGEPGKVAKPDPPPRAKREEAVAAETAIESDEDEVIERVMRRAQRLEGELIVARRQVSDLKQHIAENGSQSPELEQRLGELEAQKEELEESNGRLERQNSQLKLRVTGLVGWGDEVASAAQEATRMTAKLDELRQIVDQRGARDPGA